MVLVERVRYCVLSIRTYIVVLLNPVAGVLSGYDSVFLHPYLQYGSIEPVAGLVECVR